MFENKEIAEKLQRLLDLVEGEDRAVKALERQVESLEAQNKALFEKLMSRNWEEWIHTMQMDINKTSYVEYMPLAPDADEAMAGEAMEIKDDTSE